MKPMSIATLAVALLVHVHAVSGSVIGTAAWEAPRPPAYDEVGLGLDVIFSDGFESGLLIEWDSATGDPPGTSLPPDPAIIATALDPTVAVDIYAANEFIWRAPEPVQVGVIPGAIEARRISLLRGRVLESDGSPLRGVRVTVHDGPQLGSTFSRADGVFDLAVNGGGRVALRLEKGGYFPVLRMVDAPTKDFGNVDDAVMIRGDDLVTEIVGNASELQVARGSIENDVDGARQATIFFPAGTTAEMLLPNGDSVPLPAFHVRATEYTVGAMGPAAMPAPLPENTGYTYAVELSADEAVAAGAESVGFSQPVYFYLENFVGFPVGDPVPAGYLDRKAARWVAVDNGRIIKILGTLAGLAELDVDGSGSAADPEALGALAITDDERQRLAQLYPSGSELWRLAVDHFTPYDCNWPFGPPDDATPPPDPEVESDPPAEPPSADETDEDDSPDEPDPCLQAGSIIGCENQTLGEAISLPGLPYRLHYQSDRVRGHATPALVKLRLSGASIHPELLRIEVKVSAAGRETLASLPPTSNAVYAIDWQSVDRFGRERHSPAQARIDVGFVFKAQYFADRTARARSFALWGQRQSILTASRSTAEITLWNQATISGGKVRSPVILPWTLKGEGLGGWSFGVHHRYDPATRTLILGNGHRRGAQDLAVVAPRIAGTGVPGSSGDGGSARLARLDSPRGIARGADGSIFIADTVNHLVRRVRPDGIIETVAGNGSPCTSTDGCGEGGPATEAQVSNPRSLAQLPNGELVMALETCLRVVGLSGTIRTIAGVCYHTGSLADADAPEDCDDCPSADAEFVDLSDVVATPAGAILIADAGANTIRSIGTDGNISRVAGTGDSGAGGDGGPALEAQLSAPRGLDLASDGTILIADSQNHRIRRVGLDGVIRTVAGTGSQGLAGDGGPATSADLDSPADVLSDSAGGFLIADTRNARIRRVSGTGRISTVAGSGADPGGFEDGTRALQTPLADPVSLSGGGSGEYLVAESAGNHVLEMGSGGAVPQGSDILIPDEGGREVWVFDAQGRHLRTINALTGATLLTFSYTNAGKLDRIIDGDGNFTSVQRDGSGVAAAIVGPYGQATTLAYDPHGYLSQLTDSAGHIQSFTYSPVGLMTTATDENQHESSFSWDSLGRLQADIDAAGGTQSLTRYAEPVPNRLYPSYSVTLTGATEGKRKFSLFQNAAIKRRWFQRDPWPLPPLVTRSDEGTDGTTDTLQPDGSTSFSRRMADPVWGADVPRLESSSVATPSGLTSTYEGTTEAVLSDPFDPLSLETRVHTAMINGRQFTSTYDASLRQWLTASPLGRQTELLTDALGRPVSSRRGMLLATSFTYDARGRLESISRGTGVDERRIDFDYDELGRVATITDPLLRQVTFGYDAANRVTSQTLPGGRTVLFGWDAKGNLTSLTPPGRPAHGFSYTPVDLTAEYAPPEVGQGPPETAYEFDLDKKPTLITRPDGQTIALTYDHADRLTAVTSPRGTATIDYDPATGHVSTLTTPEGNSLSYTMDGPLVTATTWSGEVNGSVERTYDNFFRVSSISVNGAYPVSYTYDDDGLLIQAGAMSLTRDPATGFLTGTTLGVVTTSYTYSPFGELATMSASVSGSPIYTTTYTRDKLGRITTKVEMIQGVTKTYDYGYDAAGRLDTVAIDGILEADYDYDLNGNRLSKTTPGGTETGTYDDQDRMLTYGGASYTYSANGEMLTKTDGADVTSYDYDVFGNLLSVDLPGATAIDYVVDAKNRRIGRRVGGVLTQGFLWQSQLAPIAELDGSSSVVSRFVHATRINVPDYLAKSESTHRILTDHLGSPRLVVNATTGEVAQRIDYDEWGIVLQDTNPGWLPFGFVGAVPGAEPSVWRVGRRDYFAPAGRWTSKDPSGFRLGSANLFQYTYGDPVNFIDVDGRFGLALAVPVLAVAAGVLVASEILSSPAYQDWAHDTSRRITDWLNSPPPLEPMKPVIHEPSEPNVLWPNQPILRNSTPGSKPKNCPAGTLPIDVYPGLDHDDIETIKDGIGARPGDWVGIDPEGNVIGGDEKGEAEDHGPFDVYLP